MPAAVLLVLGGFASACKTKGNGIGTAPNDVPCPNTRPLATPDGTLPACDVEPNVCPYLGTCADPSAPGQSFFFCPGGTGARWKCIDATDAGPQDASTDATDGDAASGETDANETAADASDASDASVGDAVDGDTVDGSDALDDGDARDVSLDADARTD